MVNFLTEKPPDFDIYKKVLEAVLRNENFHCFLNDRNKVDTGLDYGKNDNSCKSLHKTLKSI